METSASDTVLHASAVAFEGRGVLILGASGRGKSSLALELIGLGAALVADDRTRIKVQDATLIADCPATIRDRIEVRHVGILGAQSCEAVAIHLVVDLDQTETERLPPFRQWSHGGLSLPLVHKAAFNGFPVAIRQYLIYGRSE